MANDVTIKINGKDDSGAAFNSAKSNLSSLTTQGRVFKGVFGKNLLGDLAGSLGIFGRAGLIGGAAVGLGSIADVALRGKDATFGFAESLHGLHQSLRELAFGPVPKFSESLKEFEDNAKAARVELNKLSNDAHNKFGRAMNPKNMKLDGLTNVESTAFDEFDAATKKASDDAAKRLFAVQDAGPQGYADRLRAESPGLDQGWALDQGTKNYNRELATAQRDKSRIDGERLQRLKEVEGLQHRRLLQAGVGGVGSLLSSVGRAAGGDVMNAGKGGMNRIQEGIAAVNQQIAESTAAALREAQEIVQRNLSPKEKLQAELGRVNVLGKSGFLDAKTFGRERGRLMDLINPVAKGGLTIEGILAEREKAKLGGSAGGLQASEGRFTTMGRGNLSAAEQQAAKHRERTAKAAEGSKKSLERLEKLMDVNNPQIEIVNVA